MRLDARVLGFTAGVSLLTGLVFGLIPGLSASRVSLVPSLKEGGRTSGTATRARLRGALVVSQVALALMLLVGAGLLLRSLHRLQSVDPGFDPGHLVTFNLTPPMARYGDIAKRTRLFEDVLARLAAQPGVAAVGATSELPFGTGSLFHNFVIDGRPPVEPGREPEIYNRSASPSFFAALGLPVLRGRALSEDDRATSPLVCVVNEAAVREHFAGEDPIGRRVAWARAPERVWITIVGVVGDVRAQELAAEEVPAIYTPMAQETRGWKTWMNFVVRTAEGPESFAAAARREMAAVDPNIPVTRVRAMDDLIADLGGAARASTCSCWAGSRSWPCSWPAWGCTASSPCRRAADAGDGRARGPRRHPARRGAAGRRPGARAHGGRPPLRDGRRAGADAVRVHDAVRGARDRSRHVPGGLGAARDGVRPRLLPARAARRARGPAGGVARRE